MRKQILAVIVTVAAIGLTTQSGSAAITNFSLTGSSYSQNFDAITTSATATLPTGWGFFAGGDPANPATATTVTTQDAGTTGTGVISSSSAGGNYLFVNGVLASGTD